VVYFTILLSRLGYPRSRRTQYLRYGMSSASRILRTSYMSTHMVNCVCTYEGGSGNPNSSTSELRLPQDDRSAACIVALPYSSTTFISQRCHSRANNSARL